jgi:hypothetical protein
MNDSTPTPSTPPAPIPPAPAATRTPAPIVSGPQTDLSPAQAETIAGWTREDLKSGKITEAQAASIFNDLGTPMEQRTTEDVRTDEVKLLDQHFPSAKPDEYLISYGLGDGVPMSPEMNAFDQSARAWLSGAEFPANLGNSLITQISRVAQQTKAMSPDQLEQYGFAEFAKLERAYGNTLDERLRAAGRMVEDLERKQPGLKNLLKSKGLGDNAMIASLLIQQSERYWARRKGK